VNARDFLSAYQSRMFECKLADSSSLLARDDFDRLEDSRINFVLDSRVLAFKVLPDDNHVDVLVSHIVDVRQSSQMQH
jgi:hypothetical protein